MRLGLRLGSAAAAAHATWPTRRSRRHGGMGTEQVQVTVCVANAFTTVSPEPQSCYCESFRCDKGELKPRPPKTNPHFSGGPVLNFIVAFTKVQ